MIKMFIGWSKWLVVVLLTGLAPAAPPGVQIAGDGKPLAVIVLPKDPPLEIRHAAEELKSYVKRMSGAELSVGDRAAAEAEIRLEVDPSLNRPPQDRRDWPGARGYRLRAEGQSMRIIGGDRLGVLQGVYGLLERHLGVRWLWPGELGEVVPRRKTIVVGPLEETSRPDFAVRWVGGGDWALRHGSNAMVQIGRLAVGVKWRWHFHTFNELIPAEKYYEKHPEWWPLVGGKRQRPTQPDSHSTQLCTSNAELVAQLTRNLLAVLDREPDIEIIALSPNDGGGFCECENCRALDEPDRGWFARYSKRLAVLNNQVAGEVAKRHARVLVKVGAYAMYLRRPLDESLAPTKNLLVQICHIYCCHNHPIEGAGCLEGKTFFAKKEFIPNQEFRRILLDWKRVTDHLFVYEYYTLAGPSRLDLPWPMVHALRQDMPFYKRAGAEGFYTQLTETLFHRHGLNYYLAAKLAWDTGLDVDGVSDDYCRSAFGPAAGAMSGYFRRLEQAMVEADLCLSYGQESPQRWAPRVFSETVMRQAQGCLLRAAELAPGGPERQRVAFFRRGFDEAAASLLKIRAKPASLGGPKKGK